LILYVKLRLSPLKGTNGRTPGERRREREEEKTKNVRLPPVEILISSHQDRREEKEEEENKIRLPPVKILISPHQERRREK
jgi:hypothetical protein